MSGARRKIACSRAHIALLAIVAACAQSPSAQLAQELDTIRSWAATARMTGEAWLAGATPDAYASQTLRTVAEALDQERRSLARLPIAHDRDAVEGRVLALERAASDAASAVARGDRSAAGEPLARIAAEAARLMMADAATSPKP